MNHEVSQWLAEIQSLKVQLAQALREREDAQASEGNWRQLYETEAKQRRTEARMYERSLSELEAKVRQMEGRLPLDDEDEQDQEAAIAAVVHSELSQLHEPEAIAAKLRQVLLENTRLRSEVHRLSQLLQAEQASHEQTRRSLTTALGDTIDSLARERASRKHEPPTPEGQAVPEGISDFDAQNRESRNPSPELPPLGQAQFPA